MSEKRLAKEDAGLMKGALGAIESTIMGIAGTAPAYSVAATTATIVGAVGVLSIGSILYSGLIMFGLVMAFIQLNKIEPNAGATYTWVGKVFGESWGFFAGWGLLVASVVFMVSATIPAATATLLIVAPGLEESTNWVTFTAAIWLTFVSAVVVKGIKQSSFLQITMTVIETGIIVAIVIAAFIQYGGKPAHPYSIDWISPFAFTPELFATGALTAIFFYWGWDVTMNLGEETKEATKQGETHPAGKGSFWAIINLILIYLILLSVVLIVLNDEEIEIANTNVLFAIANKLFPEPWGYLAVLSTILSTIGTIETQIICFTRSMFAMSRDKILNPRYSAIHPSWQTPYKANIFIWVAAVLLLFGSSYIDTVGHILENSILAIGFQVSFYLSLAGFACAWYYREKLTKGIKDSFLYVLWPASSASFMVFIALYSIPDFDNITIAIGLGGLIIGFIPLVWNKMLKPRY